MTDAQAQFLVEQTLFVGDLQFLIVALLTLAVAVPSLVHAWRTKWLLGDLRRLYLALFGATSFAVTFFVTAKSQAFLGVRDVQAALAVDRLVEPHFLARIVDQARIAMGSQAFDAWLSQTSSGLLSGRWLNVAIPFAILSGIVAMLVMAGKATTSRSEAYVVVHDMKGRTTLMVRDEHVERFRRSNIPISESIDTPPTMLAAVVSAIVFGGVAYWFAVQVSYFRDPLGAWFS